MIHNLKILPVFFKAVANGTKTFEIRKNDRKFNVGDIIKLREYGTSGYTGRVVTGKITFITNFEQKDGYVVFSFIKG